MCLQNKWRLTDWTTIGKIMENHVHEFGGNDGWYTMIHSKISSVLSRTMCGIVCNFLQGISSPLSPGSVFLMGTCKYSSVLLPNPSRKMVVSSMEHQLANFDCVDFADACSIFSILCQFQLFFSMFLPLSCSTTKGLRQAWKIPIAECPNWGIMTVP